MPPLPQVVLDLQHSVTMPFASQTPSKLASVQSPPAAMFPTWRYGVAPPHCPSAIDVPLVDRALPLLPPLLQFVLILQHCASILLASQRPSRSVSEQPVVSLVGSNTRPPEQAPGTAGPRPCPCTTAPSGPPSPQLVPFLQQIVSTLLASQTPSMSTSPHSCDCCAGL